ncbi:hypothetical protein WJX72_007278 [[Myrmecia] bisecta]|uniref:Uncharacterized protein n=1 Tax=[Myrmecia] bisecta TaxID=41462 RepID=A0AAW1Q5Y3_9CHLO
MASAATCVPAPVFSKLNGLEGLATWNHQDRSILVGLATTAIALWWFGWYTLFSARARAINGVSLLRRCAFYYCVSVGAFGAIRGIWDTGRLLLVGAAFHNLMEWGFLAHVWLDQKTAPLFFRAAVFYSWCVITITAVLLPQLLQSVAFEQTLGIQCDYFLALSYGLAWATRHHISKDISAMWRSAFFASLLHFFQIWPLVAGSVLGPCHPLSRVLEFLLTTGSMPCFYFYTDFALRWDEQKFGTTSPPGSSSGAADQPLYIPLPNGNIKLLDTWLHSKFAPPTAKRHNPYQTKNHWNALINCIGPSRVPHPFAIIRAQHSHNGAWPSCAPAAATTPHSSPAKEGHAYSVLSGATVLGLLTLLGTGAGVATMVMHQLSKVSKGVSGFIHNVEGTIHDVQDMVHSVEGTVHKIADQALHSGATAGTSGTAPSAASSSSVAAPSAAPAAGAPTSTPAPDTSSVSAAPPAPSASSTATSATTAGK